MGKGGKQGGRETRRKGGVSLWVVSGPGIGRAGVNNQREGMEEEVSFEYLESWSDSKVGLLSCHPYHFIIMAHDIFFTCAGNLSSLSQSYALPDAVWRRRPHLSALSNWGLAPPESPDESLGIG